MLRVDPLSSWRKQRSTYPELDYGNGHDGFRKSLYNSLGLKLTSIAWTEVDLDDERLSKLISYLETANAKKWATLGACLINELPEPPNEFDYPWYTYYEESNWQFDQDDNYYPTCKTAHIPTHKHFLDGCYFSEKLTSFIKEKRYSGLEFYWAKDVSKTKAKQWYWAIPEYPLGRGLDHPLIPDESLEELKIQAIASRLELLDEYQRRCKPSKDDYENTKKKIYNEETYLHQPKNRFALHRLEHFNIKSSDTFSNLALKKLVSLVEQRSSITLNFTSYNHQFLERHAPDTDFAFIVNSPNSSQHERECKYKYQVVFNRRVKEALLEKNLIDQEYLAGIALTKAPEEGQQNLDSSLPQIDPILSAEQLTYLRYHEQFWRQKFNSNKPLPKYLINKSLQLIRNAKKRSIKDFCKGIARKKIDEYLTDHHLELPEAWIKLLTITNGGDIGFENSCYLTQLLELKEFNQETRLSFLQMDENTSDCYVCIATNTFGDIFALVKNKHWPQEAPVVLLSHEDYTIEREWNNIAEFLHYATEEKI